uniref:Uncharacterized protein n=1 Tax=Cacopsylla melanoneura TaxID=428564 RepID=A0A8D9B550_9HEMI
MRRPCLYLLRRTCTIHTFSPVCMYTLPTIPTTGKSLSIRARPIRMRITVTPCIQDGLMRITHIIRLMSRRTDTMRMVPRLSYILCPIKGTMCVGVKTNGEMTLF